MRKFLASALAALTFGGAVVATAAPAQADSYRHRSYYRHHHHSGGDKAAIAAIAGIAGLAIGAAIADGDNGRTRSRSSGYYSDRGYSYRNGYRYNPYDDGYYGDYYGGRRDRVCITRERVWDPYIGRNVSIERRYPC